MNINLEDPRLSAYALGEMDEAERGEFEALLEQDAAARAEVEEIRALAGALSAELREEPAAAMSEVRRDKVMAAAAGNVVALPMRRSRFSLLRVAAMLLVVGVAVAILIPATALRRPRSATAPLLTLSQMGVKEANVDERELARTEYSDRMAVSPQDGPKGAPQVVSVPPAVAGDSSQAVEPPKAEPMEALKVDLPKPQFVGTPSKIDNARLAPEAKEQMQSLGYAGVPAAAPPQGGGLQNVTVGGQITIRNSGSSTLDRNRDAYGRDINGNLYPQPAPGLPPRDILLRNWQFEGESYKGIVENEFKLVTTEPLSTFSIDVDTASYANVRRFLNDGQLPPPDAVRIEELVNYFKYDYPEPEGESPFSVTVEASACPWNRGHSLALIGLKGRSIPIGERAPINLVFLLDVSGSMQPENKLPLLKKAMRLLVDFLGEQDRVGIVTYASNTGVALPSTSGADKGRILSVLDVLRAGGSTNGAGGIQLAYDMAARNFIRGGVNRIVLATDGDFNVGISDTDQLTRFIQEKANSGVFLSVLGFGEGNLQDDKLEGLADKGNGNYAYIDTFAEARRVLLDDVAGTMMPIAKDVKIQIEFNPAQVGAYRLVGYENRILAARDFNDDRKDAGEIGSGHTVTALYELVPPDRTGGLGGVDALKYQQGAPEEQQAQPRRGDTDELMTVKLRYKQPNGQESTRFDVPVLAREQGGASGNFKFASAVAMFGMLLRDSQHRGAATFDMALALAEEARGADKTGQRTEFLSLVQTARALAGPIPVLAQDDGPAPGVPEMASKPPAAAPGVPPGFDSGEMATEELRLDLPKPMFVGTPKNIVSANLDPNTGKPRAPFMVPVGTHMLSQGMPVTASDEQPIIGEIDMVTDGDKEGADGSFVEFGPGVQWVQIDLGQVRELRAIMVWHYHSQARLYHDVIVRCSNDADFIKYTELFNNDHDNTAKLGVGRDYDYIETNMGRLIDGKGVNARYVRLYSNGNTSNDMNHMIEVEVFGR